MKNIKGSTGVKIAAWAAISVSGLLFMAGAATAFIMADVGVYRVSEQERRRKMFESIAEKYSVMALSNQQSDNGGNKMFSEDIKNFRYGIIKAETIEGKDFNKDSTYIERNFTEKVEEEDLYKVSYLVGPGTEFDYSDSLFGGYSVYDVDEVYEEKKEISAVCYDSEKGIFYYEVSDDPDVIYPVRHMTVRIDANSDEGILYEFEYDGKRRQYHNMLQYIEESGQEGESAEVPDILSRRYITFNLFDETDVSRETWNYFCLDGRDYYGMEDIVDIGTGDRDFVEETGYERAGETLRIVRSMDYEKETYWVVSILPEEVVMDGNTDFFMQADRLIGKAYGLRYGIIFIILLSFVATLGLFVFLVSAAGHRKGTKEIVKCWPDTIPLEIYVGMIALIEFVLGGLVVLSVRRINVALNLIVTGSIAVIGILCMCWTALFFMLSLSVRIKTGTLLKNTIVWRMFRWVGRLSALLAENISLVWKAGMIYSGITILELYFLRFATGRRVVFLITEKVILIFPIFLVLLQMQKLKEGAEMLAKGDLSYRVDTGHMFWEFRNHGENLNSISRGMVRAVDERMKSERFKTELITNVSHDIKTPLTSIINYVDLLGKEELNNTSAEEYIEVLKRQSGRLKKLIEDLMEASKASTGNLEVHLEKLEAGVSMVQIIGEFEEKTKENGLELLVNKPEDPVYIMADSRHFWRVIDNLMNNICKYAQPSTRVYINLEEKEEAVTITFRNTSRYALNISGDELMERFVRGDSSRNTEGSGLGLSIAQSLMELMCGSLELYVDGDLFKVILKFRIPVQ